MAKNVQFDDFQDLLERLKKYEQKEQEFYEACAKELAARLLAKLIKRTPVGKTMRHFEDVKDASGNQVTYKSGKSKGQVKQKSITDHRGGTLRRGWTAKTEQEAAGGGTKTAAAFVTGIRVHKVGSIYQITIINPVRYASYINYGHRQEPGRYVPALGKRLKKAWVPGNHMVEISEAEIEAQQHAIIERKLKVFLEEMFDGK